MSFSRTIGRIAAGLVAGALLKLYFFSELDQVNHGGWWYYAPLINAAFFLVPVSLGIRKIR